MNPAEFVARVQPHFPIGPYTGIVYAPDCGSTSPTRFKREVHLSRNDGHGSHFDTIDAARLLVGAVVEEHDCIEFSTYPFEDGDGEGCWCILSHRGARYTGHGSTKLDAALSARAAARRATDA